MHIEPNVVEGTKMVFSYATAAGAAFIGAKMAIDTVRTDGGLNALLLRSVATTLLVLSFFQVLPHYPVGVSEVHFIFGATMYLLFGAGPATVGLALGLLLQGLLFEPTDLPQYFINITTLVIPLWIVMMVARHVVALHTPYVDLKLWQALLFAICYQGGVILMVALWSFYGQGFSAENIAAVQTFAFNYLLVIVVEPIVAMLFLQLAKKLDRFAKNPIFYNRLHHPVT